MRPRFRSNASSLLAGARVVSVLPDGGTLLLDMDGVPLLFDGENIRVVGVDLVRCKRSDIYGYSMAMQLHDAIRSTGIGRAGFIWSPDGRVALVANATAVLSRWENLYGMMLLDAHDSAPYMAEPGGRIYRYEGGVAMTENYQRAALANGMIYGFGDCWDYVAIYELGGQSYAHTCTVAGYSQGWKIFRLFSYIPADDFASDVIPAEEYPAPLAEPEYILTRKGGAADPAKALEEADTARFVGRWKASTEETADFLEFVKFRADGTCQVSEQGEMQEGVWNANSLCVAMGKEIRRMQGYAYAFEGDRLIFTYGDERYAFRRA